MTKKIDKLNPKQALFVKNLVEGKNGTASAIASGYSPKSAYSQASRLLKNAKISNCLDNAGLSDKRIAEGIMTNALAGEGIKATADTSLRAYELASRLKGYLSPDKPDFNQTTNVYIQELKMMTDQQLLEKLAAIEGEVVDLVDTTPTSK